MITLKQFQEQFQNLLFTDEPTDCEKMMIYQNSYTHSLLYALKKNYPKLEQHLGEIEFEKLSRDYIKHHPSTYYSLRWYGDKLPDFIPDNMLAELAKFEWQCGLIWDGPDYPILKVDDLFRIPEAHWESLRFQVHPNIRSINLYWNILEIWQENNNSQNIKPIYSDHSKTVILYRQNNTVFFQELSILEEKIWQGILAQYSFDQICSNIEVPADTMASVLYSWIAKGWLSHACCK